MIFTPYKPIYNEWQITHYYDCFFKKTCKVNDKLSQELKKHCQDVVKDKEKAMDLKNKLEDSINDIDKSSSISWLISIICVEIAFGFNSFKNSIIAFSILAAVVVFFIFYAGKTILLHNSYYRYYKLYLNILLSTNIYQTSETNKIKIKIKNGTSYFVDKIPQDIIENKNSKDNKIIEIIDCNNNKINLSINDIESIQF